MRSASVAVLSAVLLGAAPLSATAQSLAVNAWPNPARGGNEIRYAIPATGRGALTIYDVQQEPLGLDHLRETQHDGYRLKVQVRLDSPIEGVQVFPTYFSIHTDDADYFPERETFLLPGGDLFIAGPQKPARRFDPAANPVVDNPALQYNQLANPQRGVNMDGTAVMLPLRPPDDRPTRRRGVRHHAVRQHHDDGRDVRRGRDRRVLGAGSERPAADRLQGLATPSHSSGSNRVPPAANPRSNRPRIAAGGAERVGPRRRPAAVSRTARPG